MRHSRTPTFKFKPEPIRLRIGYQNNKKAFRIKPESIFCSTFLKYKPYKNLYYRKSMKLLIKNKVKATIRSIFSDNIR